MNTATKSSTQGHIGRVVAGSLGSGLIAAIVLVAGPLAGAREHVITGSVLLAFALGWAMLARLSERRTDQPQPWAQAPAALLWVSGVVVLVAAPTGNELGWVWPPVLAALVAWMTWKARRSLRCRNRVLVVYPVFAAMLLASAGGLYETASERHDASHFAMPGRLIDVGGHRLHLDCTGTGRPTVVLEPGLGEPSTAMARIAPIISGTTRVCVYDRAGRGWSDPVPSPLDGNETAADLHTLLERGGERGPFVLAGHSAGGIYVLDFAHQYPREVAGVVLLDSMHPEQYTKVPSWPAFYETFRRAAAVLPSLSRLGVGRLLALRAYGDLPQPARDEQRAFWSTPRHYRSVRDEVSRLRTAMAQATDLRSLGERPLVVVTAMKGAAAGWKEAQDDLASLSTNRLHRVLPNATHAMVTEDEASAAMSGRAVLAAVDAVRSGDPVDATQRRPPTMPAAPPAGRFRG